MPRAGLVDGDPAAHLDGCLEADLESSAPTMQCPCTAWACRSAPALPRRPPQAGLGTPRRGGASGGDGPGRGPSRTGACWRTRGCLIWCGWAAWSASSAMGDRGDLGCGDREGAAEEAGAAAAHVLSAGHLADGRDDPDAGRVVHAVAGPPGGLVADVPFALEWHVPTEKVVTDWQVLVPADVMESVFWEAAGPLVSDGEPSAVLRAGWRCARRTANAGEPRGHAGEPGDVRLHGHRGAGRRGCHAVPQLMALTARGGGAMLGDPRQYAGREQRRSGGWRAAAAGALRRRNRASHRL